MDICDAIKEARDCGIVHCGILNTESMSLVELTARFGLMFSPDIYQAISNVQAESVAWRILHRDLAYSSELMTESAAQSLARRFLARFDADNTQYYTNGDYYAARFNCGWMPATAATI